MRARTGSDGRGRRRATAAAEALVAANPPIGGRTRVRGVTAVAEFRVLRGRPDGQPARVGRTEGNRGWGVLSG